MRKLNSHSSFVIFVLCMLQLSVLCNGDDESIVSAPMERREQETLYSAIQGFVGKWWNGSDLYPDPCGWTPIQGVGCDVYDGLWYVTDVSIGPVHDNSPTCAQNVEFNSNIFSLKHLKSLSFYNCFVLPRQVPVSIPNQNWQVLAESLESLEFRSNPGLTGNIPESFGELVNLQSLVLTENGLTGRISSSIGKLPSLKRLNLAGNELSGNIPDSLMGFNNLLILDLSRNSLSGLLNMSFQGLSSLLKLDLSNNKLEGKIHPQIQYLKNLCCVWIAPTLILLFMILLFSHTTFTHQITFFSHKSPFLLHTLHLQTVKSRYSKINLYTNPNASLTLLDLSNNKLSGGLTKSIQELSSLEELVLSNNPNIGGDLMNVAWKNLRELTVLDLSNTSLTGGIPESITDLKGLRFLGLHDNMLTGNISSKLETLPNVTAIYVHGNNLTGKLKFSEGFYGKMGRRFGAWNNPNLCYSVGLVPTNYAPFGVNSCEGEEVSRFEMHHYLDSKFKFGNGDIKSIASLEYAVSGFNGLVFVVEMFIVLVLNILG